MVLYLMERRKSKNEREREVGGFKVLRSKLLIVF